MFTGIVETLGEITEVMSEGSNLNLVIKSSISSDLKPDQSVSHNGVCLTVTQVDSGLHKVTAIKETLDKSTLKIWKKGGFVNLERSLSLNSRLDGHWVQGHVDQVATCIGVKSMDGSTVFTFEYESVENFTVEKGSIAVDGVSLTVIDSKRNSFSVAVIPYTMKHTIFNFYEKGAVVNLEFDIIGKYVSSLYSLREKN